MWITNKKVSIISILVVGLLCSAPLAFGQIVNPISSATIPDLLGKIVTAVGQIITSLGVVMIIVSGILYLTSAGSPERIGTAKKALGGAIAGIVVGLFAQAIVEVIKGIVGAS